MIAQLGSVQFGWIYLSILLSVFSHILRAYRWQILLQPLGYHVTLNRAFWAVMVGYMANLAFPRMGEITKCSVLKKTDDVKISRSMGTVVTERLFDVILLGLSLLLTLGVEFKRLSQFFLDLADEKVPSELNLSFSSPIFLGAIAFIALLLTIFLLLRERITQSTIYHKLVEVLLNFREGLLSIRKIKNITGFVVSTFSIWFLYYLMAYVVVFSIPQTADLDWAAGLAILVVGGIGMSAPVQGGIGTYHFLVAALLILYGIERSDGVFFATLIHTSQTLMVLFLGVIGLILASIFQRVSHDES